jgi:hypothetical protein
VKPHAMSQMTHVPQLMDDVRSACTQVVQVASECAMHCLTEMDAEEMTNSIQHCLDAVDVATACLTISSRSSEHTDKICGVTAAVTDACADVCEGLAEGDSMMERCAQTCRACADACRSLIEER